MKNIKIFILIFLAAAALLFAVPKQTVQPIPALILTVIAYKFWQLWHIAPSELPFDYPQ